MGRVYEIRQMSGRPRLLQALRIRHVGSIVMANAVAAGMLVVSLSTVATES